jgi:hypothetical protein
MITEKVIIIDGILTPEKTPNTDFGNHCDGENFYFFESESERQEFYSTVENTNI